MTGFGLRASDFGGGFANLHHFALILGSSAQGIDWVGPHPTPEARSPKPRTGGAQ